ncbi:MAG: CDP-alcohol phosphatidyltransferase family protein [Oscillospiraceae bacterium]
MSELRGDCGGENMWSKVKFIIKRDWKTIPNMLSYFRLLIIPLFIWLYIGKKALYAAAAVIIVSGLSDVADGFIARHFNMVSDLGKALDPVADKLTQIAIFICLAVRYRIVLWFVCILAVKELLMLTIGLLLFKRTGLVNSAKWYGKMTTFVTEATAVILVLIPNIPMLAVNILVGLSIACVVFSFVMYARRYFKMMKEHSGDTEV